MKGFSLVEVLVAMAIVGGIALALMQLSKNSNTIQSNSLASVDYLEVVSEIDSILKSNDDCTVSLTGTVFKGSSIKSSPVQVELWVADHKGDRSRKRFSSTDPSVKKQNKIEITEIGFNMPDYTAGTDFAPGTEVFKGQITIKGNKHIQGNEKDFPTIQRSIYLSFDTDSSGQSTISSCGSNLDPEKNLSMVSCSTGGGWGDSLSRGTYACANNTTWKACMCSADWAQCKCKSGTFSGAAKGSPSCGVSGGSGDDSRGSVACTNGTSLVYCNCSADWTDGCNCNEVPNTFTSESICVGGSYGIGDSLSRPVMICSSKEKVVALHCSADWGSVCKTNSTNYSSSGYFPSCSVNSDGSGNDLTRPLGACSNSKSIIECRFSADWANGSSCRNHNF